MDSVSPVHFLAFPFSVCGLSFSVGSNCWGQFEMSDLNVRFLKNVKKIKNASFPGKVHQIDVFRLLNRTVLSFFKSSFRVSPWTPFGISYKKKQSRLFPTILRFVT